MLSQLTDGQTGYGLLIAGLLVLGRRRRPGRARAAHTLLMQARAARALPGVGSAMNDTVQQTGAALSVAVLGSVLAAAYSASLPDAVPAGRRATSIADTLALGAGHSWRRPGTAFTDAMSIAMVAGTAGAAAGAIVALVVLPRRRVVAEDERPPVEVPVG